MSMGAKVGMIAGGVTAVGGLIAIVIYFISAGSAWGEQTQQVDENKGQIETVKSKVEKLGENQSSIKTTTDTIKEDVKEAKQKQSQIAEEQASQRTILERIDRAISQQAPAQQVPVYPQPPRGYQAPPGYWQGQIPQQALPPSYEWSQQQPWGMQQQYPQQQWYPQQQYAPPPAMRR
jgi:uncharacterized phage infection (PIP) family protein YhgE